MSTGWETRWSGKSSFAELAEALGISTDDVLASWNDGGPALKVLYTRDNYEPTVIWCAALLRDQDGILRMHGEPVEQVGLWDEIKAAMIL